MQILLLEKGKPYSFELMDSKIILTEKLPVIFNILNMFLIVATHAAPTLSTDPIIGYAR